MLIQPSFPKWLFYALSWQRSWPLNIYFKALKLNLPWLAVSLFFVGEGLADLWLLDTQLRELGGQLLNLFLLVSLTLSFLVLPFYHRNFIVSLSQQLNYPYLSQTQEKQNWLKEILFFLKYYSVYLIGCGVAFFAFLFSLAFSSGFIYLLVLALILLFAFSQNYAAFLLAFLFASLGVIVSYALAFVFLSFWAHSLIFQRKNPLATSFSLVTHYFYLLLAFYVTEAFFKWYGLLLLLTLILTVFSLKIDFFSTEILKTKEILTELKAGHQSLILGSLILFVLALNVYWDVLKNTYLTLLWHQYQVEEVQALVSKANSRSL